jgi:hypothetical protein
LVDLGLSHTVRQDIGSTSRPRESD